MGMLIDEAIEILQGRDNCMEYVTDNDSEAFEMAIETMRKYQKIKNIICKWEVGLYDDEGLLDTEVLEMISDEVNGDGYVD